MIYLYAHFYNFLFTQTRQYSAEPLSYNKGFCEPATPRLRIFPLHLLGCIREAVVPLGGSAECAFGGLGQLPGAPKKGNADEAEGIFDLAGRVWTSALRPNPP